MLGTKNPVYRELKTSLESISKGKLQVINGDYISELKSEDTEYSHCIFKLDNFRSEKIYTTNERPVSADGLFKIHKNQVLKCTLEISVMGDSITTAEFIRNVRGLFSHSDYMEQNVPSISIIEMRNVKSGVIYVGGNSISYRKINIDCSVEDIITYETGYFEKVETKTEVKNG